jgi:hypothetical protein
MGRGGVGLGAPSQLLIRRQFTDVMALARAAEDQQPGRQRKTGPAKRKSHNASAQ